MSFEKYSKSKYRECLNLYKLNAPCIVIFELCFADEVIKSTLVSLYLILNHRFCLYHAYYNYFLPAEAKYNFHCNNFLFYFPKWIVTVNEWSLGKKKTIESVTMIIWQKQKS